MRINPHSVRHHYMSGEDAVVTSDVSHARLLNALQSNHVLRESLRRLPSLGLPNWYIGAGCIAQTVWNLAHGKPAIGDIVDYDLVYFDPDMSEAAETAVARRVREVLSDFPVHVDVKNQARVHLWYPVKFGYAIQPYQSTEESIATWPTTATAIGLRTGGSGVLVHAPFGTEDLFALVVRANRVQITPEIFAAKVRRWATRWSSLNVLSWQHGIGVAGSRRSPYSS